jgi:hypothetical protein
MENIPLYVCFYDMSFQNSDLIQKINLYNREAPSERIELIRDTHDNYVWTYTGCPRSMLTENRDSSVCLVLEPVGYNQGQHPRGFTYETKLSLNDVENISLYTTPYFSHISLFEKKEVSYNDSPTEADFMSLWSFFFNGYNTLSMLLTELNALMEKEALNENDLMANKNYFRMKYKGFIQNSYSFYKGDLYFQLPFFDTNITNFHSVCSLLVKLIITLYDKLYVLKYLLQEDRILDFTIMDIKLNASCCLECFRLINTNVLPIMTRLNEEIYAYSISKSDYKMQKIISLSVFLGEMLQWEKMELDHISDNTKKNFSYINAALHMKVFDVNRIHDDNLVYVQNSFRNIRTIIENLKPNSYLYRYFNLLTYETDFDILSEVNFRLNGGHQFEETVDKLLKVISQYCVIYDIAEVDGRFTDAFFNGTRLVFINTNKLKRVSRIKAECILTFLLLHILCHLTRACIDSKKVSRNTPLMKYYHKLECRQCLEFYIDVSLT